MTVDAYLNPDFTWPKKLIFLAMAALGVIICLFLILGQSRLAVSKMRGNKRKTAFYENTNHKVQLFYEMMFSGMSVMSFSCAYVVLNHMYSLVEGNLDSVESVFLHGILVFWRDGKDFFLLLLICLSCVLNTLLDRLIVPLKFLSKDDKGSIRVLGMFYAIIILIVLNFIGDESQYSPVMMYYFGLMIGRFIYFDASFMDFIHTIKNALKNLPLLLLGLLLTGILSFFGFRLGFLLERNYYIVGTFYTTIYILIAIIILYHTRFLNLFVKKPKPLKKKKKVVEEEELPEIETVENVPEEEPADKEILYSEDPNL